MLNIIITLLVVIALIQLIISLGILMESRGPSKKAQRIFVALSIFTFLWTISNIVLIFVDSKALPSNIGFFNTVNRAAYTLGALSILMIYIFNLYYPQAKKIGIIQKSTFTIGIIMVVISLSEQISGHFSINLKNELEYTVGFFSFTFIVYALAVISEILISSSRLLRHTNNKLLKRQVKTMLIGLFLTVSHAIIFIVILAPLFNNNVYLFTIGYLAPYYYIGLTVYSLVTQKLFNIRLVVARTVGYILSIGILALVYGVLAFSIIDGFIFTDTTSTTVKRATFTLLAVILATSYQPLKKYFDKITNKIFYRDAYDSQELLDSLNKVLLSTIELNKLLKNSAEAINKSIRAEFVLFGIKQIEDSPQRILGTSEKQFTKEEIEQVRQITPNLNQKIILVDELDEKDTKLHELLRKNDIAVLVRLTDKPNKKIEGLGYIVLGNKKSGGSYTRQDAQVLEIIGDELVIAIQNALRFEEIQNFAVTLQEKVDDATKKLRKANNRLIELDQTKDDFISMASHQLRTPLTSVKGYISMVMEGDVGKVTKKQNELLDKAFISSQRMVYLIADLLNVSRLRTGKFIIEPKETNLAEVIEGEIAQLKETAKGRDLELVYEKPKSFPTLMLDETKIRQVIMNFADNAIYYTPSGGHIKVSLEDRGDFVEFTVKDDGIGVPKAEQHHLFNKFYRAGNAKKARPDGTGLGLFMAKKVVIAQGGSIIFNTQEGKGSTFGFSFNKNRLLPENYKGVT